MTRFCLLSTRAAPNNAWVALLPASGFAFAHPEDGCTRVHEDGFSGQIVLVQLAAACVYQESATPQPGTADMT